MAVSASFLEMVREAFGFVPDLHVKKMFGGAGIYAGSTMFAAAMDDALYLKTDAQNAAEFEARHLPPFVFRDRHGKETEMSYRQAPEEVFEDPDEARAWVESALGAAHRKAR